jgi:hypothetical protein
MFHQPIPSAETCSQISCYCCKSGSDYNDPNVYLYCSFGYTIGNLGLLRASPFPLPTDIPQPTKCRILETWPNIARQLT